LTPFVNLALPPEYASTLLLPFAVGPKKATEMLMLGEKVTAKAAAKMGLITATTSTGKALKTAKRTADKLASRAPAAIRLTKHLLTRSPEAPVARMHREGQLFAERLQSPEFKESVDAFFEKREPDYDKAGE